MGRPRVEPVWGTVDGGRVALERAVGLLAGRARCRLAEAHRHLVRTAAEQRCDVADLARRVIRLLDTAEAIRIPVMERRRPGGDGLPGAAGLPDRAGSSDAAGSPRGDMAGLPRLDGMPRTDGMPGADGDGLPEVETVSELVAAALVDPAPVLVAAEPPGRRFTPWLATVQGVLDSLPGMTGYLTGERDADGNLTELVWAAASPEAVTSDGRRGAQLIGSPLRRQMITEERWQAYQRVLDTGEPADLGPVRIGGADFVIRAGRLGPGLLISWERAAGPRDADRLAEVERTLAAEHDLAGRLQRIILPIPAEPLDLPGLRVALRYLPATQETMVGGDWFHAAALSDGSTLLAVGDVAGHGTHAATVMAQLRHALRALSVVTSDPGTLLEHLNQLTCELGADDSELAATAVIARFDPSRGELVWAQAGHPPPLLNRRGYTAPLARPPGPMLGVVENARYANAVAGFDSGDVLLLYTDGLVEHRRRSLDVGLDALITTVDDAVRAAPRQPLGELLGRLQRANPDDDTCILAARPGVA
ncbi:SpoIIE family protein phosphatase [Actinoplanes derwentensis]|uniref:SpoIIE family protein phosphatase n=1 Tax=Actinoplanes derwentensis TaxID=113562 RepID=UPI001E4FAF7A|nr:SpoIIE family protein phosphatase [Actinoplanes derwentensis]